MFNIDDVITHHYPTLAEKPWIARPVSSTLRRLLHQQAFHDFGHKYPYLKGFEFIEQVLDYFHFSYFTSDREKERIPDSGRVIIIANHPIGSLDGLALLKLVREIRPDVKAVANNLLMQIGPLHNCLLPVNNMSGKTPKENLRKIDEWLNNEGALIIFPAGEVSRLGPTGVKDIDWHSGFLRMATKAKAPILPIHVDGRNSAVFYGASMVYKPLSTLLLVNEMFGQENNNITFTIGETIPFSSYSTSANLPYKTRVKLFKKHLYNLGKGKAGLFPTESAIASPEPRLTLRKELGNSERLGVTPDGKEIYLYRYKDESSVMREIGRLREIAFRAVGEGTGQRRDIDKYDEHYFHLVLWDPIVMEIVGAYRFCDTQAVIAQQGIECLYTHTLFDYDQGMTPFLDAGLELGRSFVQPKYWGKRSLEYLWLGIGAFLTKHPHYRYLFGPVSISNAMPHAAKELLIFFYRTYFGATNKVAQSKQPFNLDTQKEHELLSHFCGNDYQQDLKTLKVLLDNLGTGIPTLYKQYGELCEPGGVQFLDFGIDPDFANCIDGLVMVDMTKLKERKRQRYIRADQTIAKSKEKEAEAEAEEEAINV
ncbi:GNAT family N-acetyltransferase [Enterovibrio norvegicus FF-162]|uniref:L-ornithine N(alpha)-acyltransferase n=1 Tax=Enterovibrio norvegicus FF-454 TaxID=1185651 RepID=A0A1E5BY43_9GAMM|nr:lysophospholipid acyltransferase family protein [Enterovibrio norvegicus]OEE58119.1 GNAT family N-acetyltransferase [Enterovibrio norvegicus FF-454]OEE89549.1 GNAT family N-acetyltransferase [Enterovibrio norvegicus FF-162]